MYPLLISRVAICGYFADRTRSRRLPLLLGLLALAGATLLLCLGRTIAVLIVGRLLQGTSAAVVWTVGLALLVDTVGPTQMGQMVGYLSISISAAILMAPLIGGVVYKKGGYYAVFYMSFGMIILDIFLRLLLIEKKIARQWIATDDSLQQNDMEGTGLSGNAVLASGMHDTGIHSPLPAAEPLIAPKRSVPAAFTLLTSRRLLSALWCSLAHSILMTAWDATLPLRVSKLFGWDSLGAGLIFLAALVPTLLAPLVGWYVDKHGPRLAASLGLAFCIPPVILLRLVDHGGIRQVILLIALLVLLELALTVSMIPFFAEISHVVASKEKSKPGLFGTKGAYAEAYGLYNTAFSGGMLVGPLWGGYVVSKSGWGTLTWSLAILAFVSMVPATLWTGGWIGGRKNDEVEDASLKEAAASQDPRPVCAEDQEKCTKEDTRPTTTSS